jgi:enamine deaminase RidA (YjgF/YER057c/UK114 family)
MPITFFNPETLPAVDIYKQVAVASGSKTVYLAGQVSVDAAGALVGAGDIVAQAEQCYLNVAAALAAAGATFDNVAKVTVYLVNLSSDQIPLFAEGVSRAAATLGLDSLLLPPLTGIGVAALADPAYLLEVEAIAVID